MRQAEVVLELSLDPRVVVEFGDALAVSLDCAHCLRTDRTVVFAVGGASGQCHPGSAQRDDEAHPPYPGRIVERSVHRSDEGVASAIYRLEYHVDRFADAKHGPARPWSGYPTWARIGFTLACPICGHLGRASTQNNLVRPFSHACRCGHQFYVERREMPRLRWLNPDTDEWCEVRDRWGSRADV